jgi:hypothetical protein
MPDPVHFRPCHDRRQVKECPLAPHGPPPIPMHSKLLFVLLGIGLLAGCAAPVTTSPGTATDYVPAFTRVPQGYRPSLAGYFPVVSYVGCGALAPDQIREIQRDFYRPLVKSVYQNLIGALVIHGAPTASGTTFTIWLLDGSKLESGDVLAPAASGRQIGTRFYDKAITLLQQAISPEKLKEARRVATSAI